MTKLIMIKILTLLFCIEISRQNEDAVPATAVTTDSVESSVQQPLYGEPVEIELVPYTAAIYIFEFYQCVGSYVKAEWILTAGFCIVGMAAKDISVMMGSKILDEIYERRNVSKVVLHPNFTTVPLKNDIALLLMNKPFKLDSRINSIEINEKELSYSSECTLAGWGMPSSKDYFLVDRGVVVLRQAKLQLLTPETCMSLVDKDYQLKLDRTLVCAKGMYQDACNGDSGAALVCNKVQVGIASTRVGECGIDKPSLYTNVEPFKHWIDSHLRVITRSQFAVRNLSSLSIIFISVLLTIRIKI